MNRAAVLALALLVSLIALPTQPAFAAILLDTRLSEGFFDSTPDTIVFAQETTPGTPASLTRSINSSDSPEPGFGTATGTTVGSATARGAFDASGLRLGASAGATVSVSGLTAVQYGGQASAFVQFDDLITVFGGATGTPGFVRLIFDVDGTFAADVVSPNSASAEANVRFGASNATNGISVSLVDVANPPIDPPVFTGSPLPLPDSFTTDVPVIFGTSNLLAIFLSTSFTGNFAGIGFFVDPASGSATGSVNFDQTFTLLATQVLDANGNVIPDGSIVSVNNFAYPTGASAVPEPAAGALLMVGLFSMAVAARLRRN